MQVKSSFSFYLNFKFNMQFFHHPGNADYHKGETEAVDQPHESMCEPVRQDNTGHIGKAIEDIRYQISGQRSRSGRAYQVEPAVT